MKLHKPSGKLLPSEAEVEAWFVEYMTMDGWMPIKTDAGKVTRGSNRPAHARGTLDYVCVRTWGLSGTRYEGIPPAVFFVELKSGNAKTEPALLAEQTATATTLRLAGYEVCHVPEGHMDPIRYIKNWYAEHWVINYSFMRRGTVTVT